MLEQCVWLAYDSGSDGCASVNGVKSHTANTDLHQFANSFLSLSPIKLCNPHPTPLPAYPLSRSMSIKTEDQRFQATQPWFSSCTINPMITITNNYHCISMLSSQHDISLPRILTWHLNRPKTQSVENLIWYSAEKYRLTYFCLTLI